MRAIRLSIHTLVVEPRVGFTVDEDAEFLAALPSRAAQDWPTNFRNV